ncbi:hypothetical protein PDO_5052 [Rhizobium sp. PDO1-076]|uniref:hypothetical protein n=1 Tax=Rhizobium sp. PDO1-076 TaxID=1125979 RepID=UPI00024E296D|nr:hypothetical protein [Rhizobium sp. PDO1-076]EHS51775.1 hypothetical protein PDO_5052 [Rhizobium sp. PDO1-076]
MPIAGKALFDNPQLRLVRKTAASAGLNNIKAAYECPLTVLIPVHKDKTTDSRKILKAAHLGCLRKFTASAQQGSALLPLTVMANFVMPPTLRLAGYLVIFGTLLR